MNKLFMLILIISVLNPLYAGERPKRKPMSEYTDPKSPSYTPHPYPVNQSQILANLRYYVREYVDNPNIKSSLLPGTPDDHDHVLKNALNNKNGYFISAIDKVELRCDSFSDDYVWIIFIADKSGGIVSRLDMHANGLVGGQRTLDLKLLESMTAQASFKKKQAMARRTGKDILRSLTETTGLKTEPGKIRSVKAVCYPSYISDFTAPIWEVVFSNGDMYCYCDKMNTWFKALRRIKWSKERSGDRSHPLSLIQTSDYICDSISEEVIELQKL